MHVILDQNLVRGRQGEEDPYVICILHGALRTWERDLKISRRRVAGCNSFFKEKNDSPPSVVLSSRNTRFTRVIVTSSH